MKSLRRLAHGAKAQPRQDEPAPALEQPEDAEEFAEPLKEARATRLKYQKLLKASYCLRETAKAVAKASLHVATTLAETFGTSKDKGIGESFRTASRVQMDLSAFMSRYSRYIEQTMLSSLEVLLKELDQVEETNDAYELKRVQYTEHRLRAARSKPREGLGSKGEGSPANELQQAKEEFDEIAMTLGCRLLSLEQRQARSLISQLARHHRAQVVLHKKSLRRLHLASSYIHAVAMEQQSEVRLVPLDGEDDNRELEDETEQTLQEPRQLSVQSSPIIFATEASFWQNQARQAAYAVVKDVPQELPSEWSILLSTLDQTLMAMGLSTLSPSDTVFTLNAVLRAAAEAGELLHMQAGRASHKGTLPSKSAPLSFTARTVAQRLSPPLDAATEDNGSQEGRPANGGTAGSSKLALVTSNVVLGGATDAAIGSSEPLQPQELAVNVKRTVYQRSESGPLALPAGMELPALKVDFKKGLQTVAARSTLAPTRTDQGLFMATAAMPNKSPVSKSGPLLSPPVHTQSSSLALQSGGRPGVLPSPSSLAGQAQVSAAMAPRVGFSTKLGPLSRGPLSRSYSHSGPLLRSGQQLAIASSSSLQTPVQPPATAVGKQKPAKAELRSPVSDSPTVSPPSSPQQLHRLPPPPLATAQPASFAKQATPISSSGTLVDPSKKAGRSLPMSWPLSGPLYLDKPSASTSYSTSNLGASGPLLPTLAVPMPLPSPSDPSLAAAATTQAHLAGPSGQKLQRWQSHQRIPSQIVEVSDEGESMREDSPSGASLVSPTGPGYPPPPPNPPPAHPDISRQDGATMYFRTQVYNSPKPRIGPGGWPIFYEPTQSQAAKGPQEAAEYHHVAAGPLDDLSMQERSELVEQVRNVRWHSSANFAVPDWSALPQSDRQRLLQALASVIKSKRGTAWTDSGQLLELRARNGASPPQPVLSRRP
eukprot:SM000090S24340  [mRNA]  locus=s90:472787:479159:+ [translate_table: standard]